MPELPEIDHLKRSLDPVLPGAVVKGLVLSRPDIVRNIDHRRTPTRILRRKLLLGQRIAELQRCGKELAILAESGRVLVVHLGMSGQLWHCPAGERLRRSDHVHCMWLLGPGRGRLVFRDPRRFGGLWGFETAKDLVETRWADRGPDALSVNHRTLLGRLGTTRRAIKPALLDQSVVAGIGNIYADEMLFEARINPLRRACELDSATVRRLADACRLTLRRAIRAGGSTIRDYVDGQGRAGGFVQLHQAYGRAGQPCLRCGSNLRGIRLAQRATVFCPRCQRAPRGTRLSGRVYP